MKVLKKRKFTELTQVHLPLMQWAAYHPICRDYLIHIPNERKSSAREGNLLKKMGVKAGMPDLFLAYPNQFHPGFFIELKAPGKKPNKNQIEIFKKLTNAQFLVLSFDDWTKAKNSIENYLKWI